ncbi:unnamed protein product [Moneuplotes crassus]|uniref:Uncharacterized protein n=1 Tax=Euplotes crassus TaxID=5936 RepID=A0AAD1UBW4_EUPCR|nr:unnamed protein product [Moneuplotes crassus]
MVKFTWHQMITFNFCLKVKTNYISWKGVRLLFFICEADLELARGLDLCIKVLLCILILIPRISTVGNLETLSGFSGVIRSSYFTSKRKPGQKVNRTNA